MPHIYITYKSSIIEVIFTANKKKDKENLNEKDFHSLYEAQLVNRAEVSVTKLFTAVVLFNGMMDELNNITQATLETER